MRRLLSLLADRAGMILSPTQLRKLGGAKFATNPVCVGAFKYTDRFAKARQLVAKSGVETPIPVKLLLEASSQNERLGQVIQAMAREAGFAVSVQPSEFTTALGRGDQGDFDVFQVGWSGRIDPDGNLYNLQQSEGTLNYGGEANPTVDKLLDEGRTTTDTAKRRDIYQRMIAQLRRDWNLIYLYHDKLFTGSRSDVSGVEVRPDGLPRVAFASVGGKGGV